MNALAPVADRIDPLIRRLASDRDGEVLACVRAIGRQLDKAGASWHDLADKLTSDLETPAQSHEQPVFYDALTACEWILRTESGQLTANEIRFVRSMVGILYRWPAWPKQSRWISALVAKLGGRFDVQS